MSAQVKTALTWSQLLALAAAGIYLTLFHLPDPEPGPSHAGAVISGVVPRSAGRHRHDDGEDVARRTDIAIENENRFTEPADLRRERLRATAVARRFFAAFARYEVGALDIAVKRLLRETATRAFAATLLRAPPRAPSRSDAPAVKARLSAPVFVARRVDDDGRLKSADLVGTASRHGMRSSAIAIELVRRGGGWMVCGVGP